MDVDQQDSPPPRPGRRLRTALGVVVLLLAVGYLLTSLDLAAAGSALHTGTDALVAAPERLAVALGCYAAAFGLRAWAWHALLPGLRLAQSWAALHVSLLGNHLLPLRLGEVLRVTSVLRRTGLPTHPVLASAVTLRAADLLAVLLLALLAGPVVATGLLGDWGGAALAGAITLAAALLVPGLVWLRRQARGGQLASTPSVPVTVALIGSVPLAWVLESVVLWEIARLVGHPLTVAEAIAVTAVTIAAQAVAVTPAGLGTYEAAATAALVALGVPASPAFAVALVTHAVKTGYSFVVGAVALAVPAPSYWGRLRLPRRLPPRPARVPVSTTDPVVAFLPVHNERDTVGEVVAALPRWVDARPLVVLVVDDGSVDDSGARAAEAGAVVVRQPSNLGLGAAVRRGLAEATRYRPAAVVYLDSDGEYRPSDLPAVAAPVLSGAADYVVGSRFAGRIDRMLPHRRFGNRVLTAWVRWLTRRRDLTDGQSGYRAFSPAAAAAAEVVHDYNYAQVLTLDLLAKGFLYAEVPIGYAFRDSGTSFVTLGRYLCRVIPAVHRELNADRVAARRHLQHAVKGPAPATVPPVKDSGRPRIGVRLEPPRCKSGRLR